MIIGSLFSGIGGLELGLEMCGLGPVIWQAEKDPYASAVLAKHWPETKRYEDVRDIDERSERPDIICGGFPCQDISNAGKRAGLAGTRSGLWSEYARIVGTLRPSFVFVENVAALVTRGLGTVLGDLAAFGFNAEWDVFRASDVGAPHRRERLFILAYAKGVQFQGLAHAGTDGARHTSEGALPGPGEILAERGTGRSQGDVVDAGGVRGDARIEGPQDRHGIRHLFPPGQRDIAGWDGPQPAVCRGPDGIPGRVDRLRCLGNAVVPQVAALAWRTLSERLR